MTDCACGLTPPTTFPAEPAKGDRCPIGPMNLHHWHDDQCVFCSRTRAVRCFGHYETSEYFMYGPPAVGHCALRHGHDGPCGDGEGITS